MSYVFVVSFVTYIVVTVIKFFNINKKWLPIINIFIGCIASAICIYIGIIPANNPMEIFDAISSCIIASLGAGGFYDIFEQQSKYSELGSLTYSEAVKYTNIETTNLDEAPTDHSKNDSIVVDNDEEVEG